MWTPAQKSSKSKGSTSASGGHAVGERAHPMLPPDIPSYSLSESQPSSSIGSTPSSTHNNNVQTLESRVRKLAVRVIEGTI
ncbi:hypothetical protein Naga_100540g1 [Nannochloropsis gaditana]|uniref:Uncharacterized protein n=1 Tax=Nannochloropsis gaditana TaxID=72520 RepID=W7T6S7_9STRA|nr:hypothetical protein Naga_100540g1 [Nannochloropsis gaditana]